MALNQESSWKCCVGVAVCIIAAMICCSFLGYLDPLVFVAILVVVLLCTIFFALLRKPPRGENQPATIASAQQ